MEDSFNYSTKRVTEREQIRDPKGSKKKKRRYGKSLLTKRGGVLLP